MDLSPSRLVEAEGSDLSPASGARRSSGRAGEPGGVATRFSRRLVESRLSAIAEGTLLLREGNRLRRFGRPAADGLEADLEVLDPALWRAIARGGSLGAAESYLAGDWSSSDLTSLVRLLARNRAALEGLERGAARLATAAARLGHRWKTNTRRGSRRNIEAHYDLGNDFFRLFLDESMTYSSALFARPGMTLAEAQEAKIDRLCRKLRLESGDHLLEIGSGWGALAIHAATRYGCRVTTTTISPSQRTEALARVAAAGLSDRVTILDRDYRDLAGRFDKIVSVEMIEAVGHERMEGFFATLDRRLAPGGLAALQAITIADRTYDSARRSVDFIQKYIFPGGAIPSIASLTAAASRASRLTPLHVEEMGLHYATTIRLWRQHFEANLDQVRAMGFDERFIRRWRYYFAYCEGGFLERAIGVAQLLFAGPEYRGATLIGELPA